MGEVYDTECVRKALADALEQIEQAVATAGNTVQVKVDHAMHEMKAAASDTGKAVSVLSSGSEVATIESSSKADVQGDGTHALNQAYDEAIVELREQISALSGEMAASKVASDAKTSATVYGTCAKDDAGADNCDLREEVAALSVSIKQLESSVAQSQSHG